MTDDTLTPAPRFERFRLTYPSGTVIDSYCGEGCALEEMMAAHPLAKVGVITISCV